MEGKHKIVAYLLFVIVLAVCATATYYPSGLPETDDIFIFNTNGYIEFNATGADMNVTSII